MSTFLSLWNLDSYQRIFIWTHRGLVGFLFLWPLEEERGHPGNHAYEFWWDTNNQSTSRSFWWPLPIPHLIHSLLSPFLTYPLAGREKGLNERLGQDTPLQPGHFLINSLSRYTEGNQTNFYFKFHFSKRHIHTTLFNP